MSLKSPINVVHYSYSWLPTTQTWMFNQISHMPQSIQSSIVCEHLVNAEQFLLPRTICLSRDRSFKYIFDKIIQKAGGRRHLGLLVKEAQHFHAQILHSHFANFGWVNIPAAKRAGLKHVVTFYGYDVNMLPTQEPIWLERYQELFATVDLILCEGSFMAQSVVNLGCPKDKVRVHHLGVCVNDIRYQPRMLKKDESFRILIAASFQEKKGIPYALEALGKLKDDISFEITIIGDASSEPSSQNEKRKIMKTIQRVGLEKKIRMLGYQPYTVLFDEAYKHHLFVTPSITARNGDTEGGAPVTLIEMMATGMPCISTFHCDIPEIIEHQKTGLLAPERDIDGLMKHIKWLMDCSESGGWKSITDRARLHIEQNYNVIEQSKKLGEIYKSLLN